METCVAARGIYGHNGDGHNGAGHNGVERGIDGHNVGVQWGHIFRAMQNNYHGDGHKGGGSQAEVTTGVQKAPKARADELGIEVNAWTHHQQTWGTKKQQAQTVSPKRTWQKDRYKGCKGPNLVVTYKCGWAASRERLETIGKAYPNVTVGLQGTGRQ